MDAIEVSRFMQTECQKVEDAESGDVHVFSSLSFLFPACSWFLLVWISSGIQWVTPIYSLPVLFWIHWSHLLLLSISSVWLPLGFFISALCRCHHMGRLAILPVVSLSLLQALSSYQPLLPTVFSALCQSSRSLFFGSLWYSCLAVSEAFISDAAGSSEVHWEDFRFQ